MVGFEASAYLQQLLARLPRGAAWTRRTDSVSAKVLLALASALARVDKAANAHIDELDPRSTILLLPEWEQQLGLPDDCAGSADTIDRRRAAVIAKLTASGGQSKSFFLELADRLGYPITIAEFRAYTCETSIDTPVYDESWHFAWRVNAPETTIREFTCDSACTDPLASWGNEVLECVFRRLKPAHTHIIFAYGG